MKKLRIVVPKGRIAKKVIQLLEEAGMKLLIDERVYRPIVNDTTVEVKIMKPQNIPKLLELGSHDVGFTGHDWVVETSADVEEIMNLKFDPVKIVAAIPESQNLNTLKSNKIVVATEYQNITTNYLKKEGFNFVLLRTFGATEVFPPDDADMIVDNTSTGRTLIEHELKIISEILTSATCFIGNKTALSDPWKYEKIMEMKMLFQAILDARGRVMLEMNVPSAKLEEVIRVLPGMRSPTVSHLYGDQGFAIKAAVTKLDAVKLIPMLKKIGATDILEYDFKKVIV